MSCTPYRFSLIFSNRNQTRIPFRGRSIHTSTCSLPHLILNLAPCGQSELLATNVQTCKLTQPYRRIIAFSPHTAQGPIFTPIARRQPRNPCCTNKPEKRQFSHYSFHTLRWALRTTGQQRSISRMRPRPLFTCRPTAASRKVLTMNLAYDEAPSQGKRSR